MHKEFTYPRPGLLSFFAFTIVILVLGIIAKAFWPELSSASNYTYRIIVMIIFLSMIFCIGLILTTLILNYFGIRKIIASDETIIIKNVFNTNKIKWEMINEFGRYKVGTGYCNYTQFYLKTFDCSDSKIMLCTNNLSNIEGLVETVFCKATQAKFITIENTACVPFTKQIEIVPWHKNDSLDF